MKICFLMEDGQVDKEHYFENKELLMKYIKNFGSGIVKVLRYIPVTKNWLVYDKNGEFAIRSNFVE